MYIYLLYLTCKLIFHIIFRFFFENAGKITSFVACKLALLLLPLIKINVKAFCSFYMLLRNNFSNVFYVVCR